MSPLLPAWIVPLLLFTLIGAAQETAPAPLQVPPENVQPLLIRRVAPAYPPLARQARIQGTVVLQIVINKSGEVSDLKLYSGHPMLAPAAIEAVKQWRYRPYEQDGQPVEIQTTVQVNFSMPDGGSTGVRDMTGEPVPNLAPGGQVHVCDDTSANDGPRRVRVSQGVMQGLILEKHAPEYPSDARKAHIEGTVLLGAEVGKNGSICDLALISGHPLLAPAAIDAVRQWKYRPYLLNGQPVEVETQIQVNFTLQR